MRMSELFVLGVAIVTGKMAFAVAKASLQTVPHMDLKRYVGRWYEIARYPTRFEKDCACDVTATYTQLRSKATGYLQRPVRPARSVQGVHDPARHEGMSRTRRNGERENEPICYRDS